MRQATQGEQQGACTCGEEQRRWIRFGAQCARLEALDDAVQALIAAGMSRADVEDNVAESLSFATGRATS